MRIIWATRGLSWGFRFIRDGGFADPLPQYEADFAGVEDQSELYRRVADRVVLRIPDPAGRKDRSCRTIRHDFIVFDSAAKAVKSIEDGLLHIWPTVADEYAEIWDRSGR